MAPSSCPGQSCRRARLQSAQGKQPRGERPPGIPVPLRTLPRLRPSPALPEARDAQLDVWLSSLAGVAQLARGPSRLPAGGGACMGGSHDASLSGSLPSTSRKNNSSFKKPAFLFMLVQAGTCLTGHTRHSEPPSAPPATHTAI